ncbi:MAG TPA: diguanylate cyclase [Syntrophorhabdaceae bacterium]|nr:diguanylate cyclase [Syntrophorhabdaceae bacterium]HNT68110.1 diguanylate cyclase [Syntrophorhabdaceae bacterium]
MDETKRLFVIDDDKATLTVLTEYFEHYGLKVYPFKDPPDLEKELKEKEPRAVLLDIMLPGISGVEILQRIKNIKPDIPVIMMTGYTNDERRVESLRKGAYTILTKPFESFEEVYHVVNNAMDHYIESLKTTELARRVEETKRLEKINIQEIDFLKSLQHMIGEAEDSAFVLKNAYALLKSFLNFEYFGALLTYGNEVNIQIYPKVSSNRKLAEVITNILLRRMSQGAVNAKLTSAQDDYQSLMVELSTTNTVYGFAGLFRSTPFQAQEEATFSKFCSHISVTLEKIRLFQEIKTLSIHDGLTGIYNHTYIINKLNEEIERAKRYHSDLSVMLFDLDNFKDVNDTYGHLAGDFVLQKVAELFTKRLRTIDIVGRYGGEEFLVILPETDLERAYVVGERLRTGVEQEPFIYEDHQIKLTVSGGIGLYQQGHIANDLIKIADNNLYKAKREGKNRLDYD